MTLPEDMDPIGRRLRAIEAELRSLRGRNPLASATLDDEDGVRRINFGRLGDDDFGLEVLDSDAEPVLLVGNDDAEIVLRNPSIAAGPLRLSAADGIELPVWNPGGDGDPTISQIRWMNAADEQQASILLTQSTESQLFITVADQPFGAHSIALAPENSSHMFYVSGEEVTIFGTNVGFANSLPAGTGTTLAVNGSNRIVRVTSSDRYKHNIRPLDAGVLDDVEPVVFDRDDTSDEPGFIAEQVAEVVPGAVVRNADGEPESITALSMVSLLWSEVQRLSARVDELEQRCSPG